MPRRTGLGKGLDALIPGGQSSQPDGSVAQVSVDRISPNPRQPRTELNNAELEHLADSIREHGVIQPLIVIPGDQPDEYILIAGERRLRASRIVGLETVPVVIRSATEQQKLELALIENVQRADLTPLETAEAYRQLADEFDISHEDIARRVGKSRESVTNTLRLLKLPRAVKEALNHGKISQGHAIALLMLPTPQGQETALDTVLKYELNVRQTEALVQKMRGERPEHIAKASTSPEISALEDRLRTYLGTRVNLRHGKRGGSLVIHYYSDEELNALVSQIIRGE